MKKTVLNQTLTAKLLPVDCGKGQAVCLMTAEGGKLLDLLKEQDLIETEEENLKKFDTPSIISKVNSSLFLFFYFYI